VRSAKAKLSGYPYLSGADTPRRGEVSLSEVIIHDDENFERALKRFKKKCEKAGILSDLRKHRHYEKPSERRKRKMNAAIRKNRRSRHG
jgi:small subunit ribosomal protein S21